MQYTPKIDRDITNRLVETVQDYQNRLSGNKGVELRLKQVLTHSTGENFQKNIEDRLDLSKAKRKKKIKKNISTGLRDAVDNIKGDDLVNRIKQ